MQSLKDIAIRFGNLSAEQQQKFLVSLKSKNIEFARLPIVAATPDRRRMLSYAQIRQWFLWKLDPASTAYHISGALRLTGRFHKEFLQIGFDALVARHESLCTVFHVDEQGQVEQRVREPGAMKSFISFQDFSMLDAQEREARARREARLLHETPFDLTAGPLLRVGLMRLQADEHLLVVAMHHIISDAWSMQILIREFVSQYRALASDEKLQLPEFPVQYADYAVWQRNWLEAGEKERQLDYWRAQLGDEHPVLQLPLDHPRRANGNYGAANCRIQLPADLVKGLKKIAGAEDATLFMVLLAGFQLLLSRFTGQNDIRVGVPIANRHRAETQNLIGFFVNTQILRGVMDPRASLRQLIRQARETTLGAQAHQDLPFEQLVEALQPERSLNHNPLFQVMLNHQRSSDQILDQLPGLKLANYSLGDMTAQFELTLNTCEDANGGLSADFIYARELFEAGTIARMADHYLGLLSALVETPDAGINEIDLLGKTERTQLREWGVNSGIYADASPVHRLFEQQAQKRPDATALIFADAKLTYGELNARANQLAHYLIGLGVKPETRVGIAVERSIEMVVGLLAILKAGGAYVPLDPEYPQDRLAYMIEDSGVELLLLQNALRGKIPAPDSIITIELDSLKVANKPCHNPPVPVNGDNLIYVIYTSGSTGKPKGAANRHISVSSCMQWMQETYGLTDEDTVLHKAPFGFDVSAWELFWPLTTGARLAFAAPGDHRDPARIIELIRRHKITTLNFVPAMLQAFLAQEGIEHQTRLRHIICGGEAMPAATQEETLARLQGASLQNLYGPTEAAIHVTRWTCRADGKNQVPIGRPITGIQTWVLDEGLNPVLPGVAGELYLGGIGLGRGYLNRAALTSERFIADPLGSGGRLYRTGDLVRWNGEGQLDYLGRIDHQVKIRGFRIELGEIEAQLLAQPEVREVVVVAQSGPAGARLVGYVSLHPQSDQQTVEGAQLRARLTEVLPDYMVPSAVVVLDRLPLNANGKVDRKALPVPEFTGERNYAAPRGEVEENLARIWGEVLGVERVGRHDHFFELGGHSLLALTLLEAMRRQGLSAQVRTLFQHPRLADFAQAVKLSASRRELAIPPNRIPPGCTAIEPEMVTLIELSAAEIRAIEAAVPGGAANIQDIYPLAPLQEGLLFLHRLEAEHDSYVTSHTLSFDSRERLERFVDSFNQVIARHDILRTAVLWEGLREPVQVVYRQAALSLQWREKFDPRHRRIDVRQAPMFRLIAAQDPTDKRWLLQIPSHHLVLDHATLEQLVGEIALIQQGRQAELPVPLPFRDFVAQARLGVSEAEHEAFFSAMLADVEEPTAPFGLVNIQGDGSAVEETRQPLDAELAQRIRRQAQRHGVSAAALFHLAWALVVGKAAGKEDVVFGTVLLGRMQGQAGAERALGLFINTLPVRVGWAGRSVEETLRQVHIHLTGLMNHEHARLSLATRCSAVPAETPLFSSLLNYRHSRQISSAERSENWQGLEVLTSVERTNYPLGMSVTDLGVGFELVAQTDKKVGPSRVCDMMQQALIQLTDALAEHSNRPACELNLLGKQENKLLTQWAAASSNYPDTHPIHGLFERQAAQHPEAIAVIFEDRQLSYRELNSRANRLAHYLIRQGVQPETRVGIAVERSIEMVVGLLAILKAGGAYVPIDPDYPADRIAHILADSGVELLLTQSHLRERLPVAEIQSLIELDVLDLQSESIANPQVPLDGNSLAYVIYTSGSTGKPKGAQLCHHNVSRLLSATENWFHFGPSDVWTLFHSYAFDFSVWEIFGALCTGGRLVVVPFWVSRSPEDFLQLLRDQRVTVLNQTPSAFGQLVQMKNTYAESLALRLVIFGGEALEPERLRSWIEHWGDAQPQLINMYGITETTVHVTYRRITQEDLSGNRSPVGVAIPDLGMRVLDGALNPSPIGVPGELYVAGAGLARGYLNRAGLTSERFIADPQGSRGERLYRTGDLVRWNAEGQLDYLGRIDHQVKIRGFRIELGEIEAQLLAQPEVRDAVVLALDGRLVGYVALAENQVIDSSVLRTRLSEYLPDYMVPSAIVVLDRIPLNANGKVDRKALPAPEMIGSSYEAPQGEVEETLAQIWQEVLGVERVGRHDNFFELGGHSLLALKLLEKLRVHGWSAPVRTLFQRPQLSAFAQSIESINGTPTFIVPPNRIPAGCNAIQPEMVTLIELGAEEIRQIETSVPGGAANIQDIYPLAPLQEGMLFHHRLDPEKDAYVTSHTLSFDTRKRLKRFIDSFNQVIARHDILRTAVLWEKLREPVQVVYRQAVLPLKWVDTIDSRPRRIDVRQAPMFQATARYESESGRWLLTLLGHHMVDDNTTLQHLVQEIALIQQGRAAELPAPLPFRDFVAQARLAVSDAEHQAFFSKMLGDVEEPTTPFGLRNIQGDGSGIEETRQSLDGDLARRIRRQAQQQGVSAAALFHLAWALVAGSASSRDDVVFGTVLFGRLQGVEGAGRALGLFINTLPIRIQWRKEGVKNALNQVHTTLTDLVHHEHARLSLAVRCSGVSGEIPLFSSLLNYRHTRQLATENHEAAWEGMESLESAERTNYPLGMSVNDKGDSFDLIAQVDSAAGSARVCAMMHEAVMQITEALEKDPQRPVSALELIGRDEHARILRWGNFPLTLSTTNPDTHPNYPDTNSNYPDIHPIHDLFERQAAQYPEAIAVVFEDRQLSYRELNSRANRLAHYLIRQGVQPETRVGIAVERSIEMVMGLLAILKAGGAYVPIDPDYPADRITHILADSGVELLLTQSHLRERLPVAEIQSLIELDTLDLEQESKNNPQVSLDGNSLAYVIYTSGSTGKPKGAQLCHHNVSRLLSATEHWFHFGPADVWTLFHSYAFDFSVWEIFGALCTGGRLVVVPFWISRSPEDFLQLLRDQRVTVLNQTPSAFGQLVQMKDTYAQALDLRLVIFGGEALEPERLRPWIQHWGDATPQLINMYGITETTVHVTYRRITQEDLGGNRSPVGVAIPDLGMRVLDGALNPAPIGVPGELYVAGAGLARGYLNRAGLTSERFIADPQGSHGERLYRTGDLVRWNAEGQLDYLGRIDHQVKIRGFRIELGEIEAQLLVQPEVRDAVVLALEGRLVGYVALRDEQTIDEQIIDRSRLRARLSESLPDYMVPSAIVVMDRIPLNANGKVDRKALPAPEMTGSAYEAPQGEVEETLAQIWQEVLGVERVGRHDNFFELGGHSLLALKLLEKLRTHGWSAPVRTLFQRPQLSAFAQSIEPTNRALTFIVPPNRIPAGCNAIQPEMVTLIELTAEEIWNIESSVPGGAANIQDIYPLAPLQEGILFHHLLDNQRDAYVTAYTLSFDSRKRLERFIDSFNQVIARHDILRTAVLWEKLREPVQVVYRQAVLPLQWVDSIDSRPLRIDVRQAPMFQATARHEPESGRWLLTLLGHHMVDDNTTLQHLVQEIALIQQGRKADLPPPLPFRDFVAQAKLAVSEAEHQAFFSNMLGDVKEPTAPFGLLNVRGDGTGIQEARLSLNDDLAQRIRRQAQRCGVTAAALFHLAWALVVGKASGRDDVVFGTVLFGRLQGAEGAGRALGLFINTLPIRVRWGMLDVRDALCQVQKSLTGLVHHEHARLSQAIRCSAVSGDIPLFSSLLNYRHTRQIKMEHLAGAWEGMESLESAERTNYPLALAVNDLGERFELSAQVKVGIGADRICEYMRNAVEEITEALANRSDNALCNLSIISQEEISQLLKWSINNKTIMDSLPVHQLFELQAEKRPDATAVLFQDHILTYADLNIRSNQLAHHLIRLGVKPEAKIAIVLERSFDMIIGLLGILKAGAAYVPIDPGYPQERIAHILADSGVELLLTRRDLSHSLPDVIIENEIKENGIAKLELDAIDFSDEPDHNPQMLLTGDNLMYVIYTSGSTGKPKGVAVTHRPFSIHCQDMVNVYEMNERSRELHFLSFAFDGAHERLHTALICGASVVLRDHTLWTAAETLQTMASKRVTNAGFPPAYLKELADSAETSGTHPASVRLYSFGGEAMSKESFHKVRCHLQPEILINGYGPTEAVVTPVLWKTHNKVNVQSPYAPIGKPVAARKAVVLDDALNLLPTGIVGELYLGGEGLARGYLNRGAMTSEKFIADPFDAAGGRLYRTGDLVRWNKDGELEYLGRIDHQVKIRGFRIEIGEVEAQLRALPEIKEAVVLAQEGPHGSRLLGYAVPYFPQTIDGAEIRKRLGDFLPEYMVPSVITLLDKVPVNTNGKIDRNALPAPDPISETLYEAPRGELETIIARIWQDVLGIDRIGRDDHFFELGGHSLLALKAIQRAQIQTIHSEVSIAMLMKNPQLKTFAAALLNDTNAKVEVITLSLNKKGNPLFCFPGLVVNSSEYNRLMSAVGQDRPVHAFVSHAVGPRRWELTSLNELAETYAQYIEDNCPGGVCSLLGWSFGGDIAFATAGKLAGRVKVDFLGLADVTRPVQTVRSLAEPGRVEAEKIMQVWLSRSPMESHWQKLIAQIPAELMDAVLYQVLSAEDLPLDGPEIGSVEYLQWATLDSQRMRTGFAYPYINVPIYAWEAEDSNPSGIPGRYWERYGNLRSSVIIEGTDHFSIVRDEVFVSSVRKVLNEIFSQTIQSGSNTNLADVSALME